MIPYLGLENQYIMLTLKTFTLRFDHAASSQHLMRPIFISTRTLSQIKPCHSYLLQVVRADEKSSAVLIQPRWQCGEAVVTPQQRLTAPMQAVCLDSCYAYARQHLHWS